MVRSTHSMPGSHLVLAKDIANIRVASTLPRNDSQAL